MRRRSLYFLDKDRQRERERARAAYITHKAIKNSDKPTNSNVLHLLIVHFKMAKGEGLCPNDPFQILYLSIFDGDESKIENQSTYMCFNPRVFR